MFRKESFSRKVFIIFNYIICVTMAVLCIVPLLHILAVSFSDEIAIRSGTVGLIPVGFNLSAYRYVASHAQFFKSMGISVVRVILGVAIGMFITILAAYPLSKTQRQFSARQYYVWYFMLSMLVGGGLIPTYLVIAKLKLVDTIWALVLPSAVNTFNIILLQNYIKSLPDEIMESAFVDGAGHWRNLVSIVLPLCKPVLATLVLFIAVTHWNAWFDGMIYMNRAEDFPLQSYMRSIVVEVDIELITDVDVLIANVTQKSSKSAQTFLAMLPILCVYPFLQKHFVGGIVMGSVKG